jgi:hypothetical protein
MVNLIHVKPSITVVPIRPLTLMAAVGLQWRETTADAVYVQPNSAVKGTAGAPGLWTGVYVQLRADWAITPNLAGAVEFVNFHVGDVIRRVGAGNSNYVMVQLRYAW